MHRAELLGGAGASARRLGGVTAALVVLVAVLGVLHPFFVSGDNLRNILETNSVLMLVALGMTIAMIAGGFDLSVGVLMTGTTLVIAELLNAGVPAGAALAIAVLVAAAVGAILNGIPIGLARLNFLVVTLATMSVVQGLILVRTDGNTVVLQSELITTIGNGTWLGVSWPLWFVIGGVGAAGAFLRWTSLGRAVYATGGNAEAARVAGIAIGRVTVATYALSGLFAGLAGVVSAGRLGAASPTEGGALNLVAGAAVLLGGTSFAGGEGGVAGTVLGVLLIGALQNGLGVVGVSNFWQGVVTGAVLLAAVALQRLQRERG